MFSSVAISVFSLFACIWCRVVHAIMINNTVVDTPIMECNADSVTVYFLTEKEFHGRVYVKGQSDNENCKRSTMNDLSRTSLIVTFDFNQCKATKLRIAGRGISFTLTVTVSFHTTFETKADRAYRINCMFQQSKNISFSQRFEVSTLAIMELPGETGNETDEYIYEVRQGYRNGTVVQYALIGDQVFHVWERKSSSTNNTNRPFLVHNCFVDDGQGNIIRTIDGNGCSTDIYVLRTPTYLAPDYSTVFTESHVFKYADRSHVSFQCQIRTCVNGDVECRSLIPPKCSGTTEVTHVDEYSTRTSVTAAPMTSAPRPLLSSSGSANVGRKNKTFAVLRAVQTFNDPVPRVPNEDIINHSLGSFRNVNIVTPQTLPPFDTFNSTILANRAMYRRRLSNRRARSHFYEDEIENFDTSSSNVLSNEFTVFDLVNEKGVEALIDQQSVVTSTHRNIRHSASVCIPTYSMIFAVVTSFGSLLFSTVVTFVMCCKRKT